MSANRQESGLKKPVILAEIGSNWVKLAQAEPAHGGVAFSRIYLEKFDAEGSAISQAIAGAVKKQKFARTPAIACVPRQMVNIRMLELPSTDPNEIADMVELQSGKQTPYSKDEIVSDYRIMGSARDGYARVMLAIVQRSVLRQRFSILEEAGIEVARMCVSSEGVLNWYTHAVSGGEDGSAVAVLDVDSFYSDFSIVANGVILFSKSILIGADQLLGEFEKWKEKFAREVQHSLEVWQNESPGLNAVKLLITGAGVNIEQISNYMSRETSLQAETVDCLSNVKKLPKHPSPRDPLYRPISFTALVGMALAPDNLVFNLVPDSVSLRKNLVAKAMSLTYLGILVMTALISTSLWTCLKFYFKKNRLAVLNREFLGTEAEAREIERMREVIKAVGKRLDPRLKAINLLSGIREQTPENVFFEKVEIDLDEARVRLEGTAISMGSITSLRTDLMKMPLFKEAKVEERDKVKGKYKFTIVCGWEKAK